MKERQQNATGIFFILTVFLLFQPNPDQGDLFFVVYIRDKFDFSRYLFIKAGDAKLEAQNPVAPQPEQRRFASI